MPAGRDHNEIHLVQEPRRSRARVTTAVYNAADSVPLTAIFAVAHAAHPLPLQVTLRRGAPFPGCSRCDGPVEFRFLREADPDGAHRFQVTLNVLPVIEEGAEHELPPTRRIALAG
jgi:hypothetical protein